MATLLINRSSLLDEERIAGRLRLVGAVLLLVMSAIFDGLSWTPVLIASIAVGWTAYQEWAARRLAGPSPRLHHLSLAVDIVLATSYYLAYLPHPDAIPPLLYLLVVFRLTVRYGRRGAVAAIALFGLIISVRTGVKLWGTNDEIRPPVLVLWGLVGTATVAITLELRRNIARQRPERPAEPAALPLMPAEQASEQEPPEQCTAAESDLAAQLAARFGQARHDTVLTRREWEVFELLGQGATSTEIASRLHVTTSTVRNHLHNMRVKLDLDSRDELIELANEVRARAA